MKRISLWLVPFVAMLFAPMACYRPWQQVVSVILYAEVLAFVACGLVAACVALDAPKDSTEVSR